MAAKRIRDAALLLHASRAIAQKHLRIRQDQLDAWTKTSTVGKAVKSQTDRVTLTAQAAAALAQRLNEQAPLTTQRPDPARTPASPSPPPPTPTEHSIPRRESVQSTSPIAVEKEGLQQDHHYEKSGRNTARGPPPTADIAFHQQAAPQNPLPDGTLPPPNAPTEPSMARTAADDIPEGINIDVFQTPRARRTLGRGSAPSGASDQADTQDRPHPASQATDDEVKSLASDLAQDPVASQPSQDAATTPSETSPYQMHESRVPASRLGRIWQYSGLATSMAFGAVGEGFRRVTGSGTPGRSLMLSAGNMERLVSKLSRMRGAALKLGQMISFQDLKMLPAPIHEVLQRVQDNADYMPAYQRDGVLASNLGSEWRSLFSSFEEVPLAAASIGQVHKATLASDGRPVAVKIQYPGVATSIDSDLNNLSILLTASRLLPKGLYLDKTIANARTELTWETDYKREAEAQTRFQRLLSDEPDVFTVPTVIKEASGAQVLTAELMRGTAVTKPALRLDQDQKDWIGTQILRLCFRELTEFSFMQTDPNWTNFLYNASTRKIELLDFGAARDYPERFVRPYVSVLIAAAEGDRERVRELSVELGYLTGDESKAMRDAHVASVMTLAEPFSTATAMDEAYDFRDQTVTDRVRSQIPLMVRERLAPPPEETYSLHRKLSGAFLLLARLGSRVKTRDMFVKTMEGWKRRNSVS